MNFLQNANEFAALENNPLPISLPQYYTCADFGRQLLNFSRQINKLRTARGKLGLPNVAVLSRSNSGALVYSWK